MRTLTVFLIALLACGPAEGKPFKGGRLLVRLAIVGEAYPWCDASSAWRKAHTEIVRVTRGAVPVDYEYDRAEANDRPELLTLDHFWDSSLGGYWISRIRPAPDSIRHVALPALVVGDKLMYGGMHYGRGVLGSWFYTNVQPKADCRNAYTFLHEFAHSFDIIDVCHPQRTSPDIMCYEDSATFRDCKAPLRYTAIQERAIRRKLGLRAGKTFVIEGKQ
jgi:hypothetical protein